MSKKKSGSAIFMYWVIGLMLAVSVICFVLYYGHIVPHAALLWTGITAFTILYHFWLRIIMGNVTKLFRIHRGQKWFKERKIPDFMMNKHSDFLCKIGSNTLAIYIVHQPVIYGLLTAFFWVIEKGSTV